MASTPNDLKGSGSFILTAKLVPKPGKADELVQWLSNLKKRADSDAEPGTLQYNVVRFEDHVRVWEEYANAEAFAAHEAGPLFQEFLKQGLWEEPKPEFYLAKSIPPPNID